MIHVVGVAAGTAVLASVSRGSCPAVAEWQGEWSLKMTWMGLKNHTG